MEDINLTGNANKVTDFLGKTWECECLGCAISNKDIDVPGDIIYENENILLQQDSLVPINGFLIITVKRHINSISELDKNERYELIDIISEAEKALKKLNITSEVTIVQEERSKHLHVWLFPNHEWMNIVFGKGVTYLRDICTYAQDNVTQKDIEEIMKTIGKLKEHFKDYKGE